MGIEAANASANSPSASRREGGATSPSPEASRALRVHFFALVAAIACAFLGHAAAVGVIAERKLALQRFEASLSAVMDSWHQLLMTTHRLPYRQERPKESWSGGVQVFGQFRARLEAFQQEVDRERLLDPALRQEVIDLLRGLRYGNQFIQEVYDELEAFIRSNQQGNRPILGSTMYGILRNVGGYDFEGDHLLQFFRMYQDVRDLGFSFTNLLENKQQRIQTAIQGEIARLTRLYTAIQAALLVFAATALTLLLLRQVAVFRAVQRSEQDILRLAERLIKAQEEERTRIAGELHDGILQQLTSLALNLGTVNYQVPPGSPAKSEIAGLQKNLIQIGTDLRQLSHELHPAVLQEAGLPKALSGYCCEFSKARGVPVACEAGPGVEELSPGTALALYRIAQEALGNVAKHAKATQVRVRLARAGGVVRLTICDDGVGFVPGRAGDAGGVGLVNMRERVRQLGGTLLLESEPGRGSTIQAEVPLPPAR